MAKSFVPNSYFRWVNMEHHQLEAHRPYGHVQDFLRGRIRGISAQRLESLFFQARVFVNGTVAQYDQPLHKGDRVELINRPAQLVPTPIPLTILYEDGDIMVIEKASGIAVHPGLGHYDGTLLNAMAHHYEQSGQSLDFIKKGLVHRLDRATSGLMVFAKNEASRAGLDKQFQAKHIGRVYLAAVWGQLPAPSGTINTPIGRVPGDPMKIAASIDGSFGKMALTRYAVLGAQAAVSWVALFPATGRTHQLRIHMHHIGHGIVGDERYPSQALSPHLLPQRLALHACRLAFAHPSTGEALYFKSAWPQNLHHIYAPSAKEEVVMDSLHPNDWVNQDSSLLSA